MASSLLEIAGILSDEEAEEIRDNVEALRRNWRSVDKSVEELRRTGRKAAEELSGS